MTVSAQVSLYPLGRDDLTPVIVELLKVFAASGLNYRLDTMSAIVWGDEAVVFSALQRGYATAAATGKTVMTVTISNACPIPEE